MILKIILLFLGASLSLPALGMAQFSLWLTEKKVEFRYSVPNLEHEELAEMLLSPQQSKTIIFDVRLLEEYQTSHIRTAIQIDPKMMAKTFIKEYSALIKGRTLVFYCSVGYRSSIFLERIQQQALNKGVTRMYNLKGGIFRWYNEGLPIFKQKKLTNGIHPYDEKWGSMIIKRPWKKVSLEDRDKLL